MPENVLWEHGIHLYGNDLYSFQAIHQESIVVPESVDAVRAMLGHTPNVAVSFANTDRSLGIRPPGS